MVFSSLSFISIFLPVVLILYWILPGIRVRNFLLLFASLVFYAYGEPVYVFLMIGTVLLNYLWALGMERFPGGKKAFLLLAVLQNLGVLGVYKYSGFLVELWNGWTGMELPVPQLSLPIGISFFTFQAMSYVIDVYRGGTKAQRNLFRLMLYVSLFPQLIAGPIVKYHDVEQELSERTLSLPETMLGIRRFVTGLGKKVLIANYMAVVADTLFAADPLQVNILGAWLGAVAYMLQIYFDFSGYSDMAIGLGWMFGFHFKENFRYPYGAVSMRDFWRKWHISLSGWFREYLYFPLGGNRKGRLRTCINKIIVFACTGIWHGANVTFLFWGLYHGFFLMLEEYIPFFRREGGKVKKAVLHLYVVLAVLVGFVFFRADTMAQGVLWVKTMFSGFCFDNASMQLWLSLLTPVHLAAMAAGILAAGPLGELLTSRVAAVSRGEDRGVVWTVLEKLTWVLVPALLLLCVMNLAGGTYNPFIYFRF